MRNVYNAAITWPDSSDFRKKAGDSSIEKTKSLSQHTYYRSMQGILR
jgi:hypothetical protein